MKEIFTYSVVKELQTRCFLFLGERESGFQDRILSEEHTYTVIDTKVKSAIADLQTLYRKAYPVSAGEHCKSIDRVFELYTVLQTLSPRAQMINVIGGGALIDLVGYALATSFRT